MKLTLQLEMKSDWHVGSGYGRSGDIDALIVRDADGLPYVPAKTLTGILRDACEQAAFGLDDGKTKGGWNQWVTWLFGSQPSIDQQLERPVPATLSVRPARLSEQLTNLVQGEGEYKKALRNALTFVKPGVQLDWQTGQAETGSLRMEEVARGGMILVAEADLDTDGAGNEQQRCALALLAAGCQLADRIGGKRRRGSGKVAISMISEDEPWKDFLDAQKESWKKYLEQNADRTPESPSQTAETIGAKQFGAAGSDWQCYDLILKLETPVVIRSAKKGNVVESLDYIPGTYLLGPLSRALKKAGLKDPDQAILSSQIMVENATIQVKGAKGLPMPWALFQEKVRTGTDHTVCNVLAVPLDPRKQYKGLRHGYIRYDDINATCWSKDVSMGAFMHNSVCDATQRPDESTGGVFTYMAIAAGQTFETHVWVSKSLGLNPDVVKNLPKTPLQIGLSSKDDFGAVSVEKWAPSNEELPGETDGKRLTVWLLSDVLLRNDRLRPDPTPEALQNLLQDKLGCTLKPGPSEDGNGQLLENAPFSCVGHHRRLDSWQVSWGLPRPSLVGLAAGTCLAYSVENIKNMGNYAAALRRLQQDGVGERRAEGYGRLLFNTPLLDQKQLQLPSDESSPAESPVTITHLSAVEKTTGELFGEETLKKAARTAEIRRAAAELAADSTRRRKVLGITADKPTDSQLGVLRNAMATLKCPEPIVRPNDISTVRAWLGPVCGEAMGIHGGQDANLEASKFIEKWGPNAANALHDLLWEQWDEQNRRPDRVWNWLLSAGLLQELVPHLSDGGYNTTWVEAVQTLIDQCLRFEKRDREGATGREEEATHGA